MGVFQILRDLFHRGTVETPYLDTREIMHQVYLEHRQCSSLPAGTPPHQAGLHGALGAYYRSRGMPVRELVLWAELTPFLLMEEHIGSEALVEYVLFQESREKARVQWLVSTISGVLRPAAPSKDSQRVMASLAFLKDVAWCQLLEPEVQQMLEQEAQPLAAALNDHTLPPIEE